MNREEAKRRLEVWLKCMDCPEDKQCYDSHLQSTCEYTDYCDETPICEAVKVAIKALDKEPCEDAISRAEAVRVASGYCHPANVAKELAKLPPVNPQPCEDAISRQATIKYLCTNMNWYDEDGETADDEEKLNAITDLVNGVPSVTPQPKTGHWIYTEYHTWCCSECGGNPHKGTGFVPNKDGMKMRWKYCNLCGARMVEPQES